MATAFYFTANTGMCILHHICWIHILGAYNGTIMGYTSLTKVSKLTSSINTCI